MFRNLQFRQTIKFLFQNIRSYASRGVSKADNLTAVIHGIEFLKLEQRDIPELKPHHVLLQMESVGICGSDVKYLTKGKIGPFVLKKPLIIGHEASGTVVEVGKGVRKLKVGDRVAIEPGVPCGRCSNCKKGKYNICPYLTFCATPPDDGNLSRFYVHHADFCFKLPDSMTFDQGALVEPLACACRGCKRARVKVGSEVVIFGAGPIGIVTLLVSKAMGASSVLIIDTLDYKLQMARCLGADRILKITGSTCEDDIISNIKQYFGREPSISIDCSGSEICIRIGMQVTKTGGKFIIIGCGQDEIKVPFMPTILREVDMKGVFRYLNDYPTAIELIRSCRVNVDPIITHHFRIEDTLQAFHAAKTGEGNPIKIIIHPNPNWIPPCKSPPNLCSCPC